MKSNFKIKPSISNQKGFYLAKARILNPENEGLNIFGN